MADDTNKIQAMIQYAQMLSTEGDDAGYQRVKHKIDIELGTYTRRQVPESMYNIWDLKTGTSNSTTALDAFRDHTIFDVSTEKLHLENEINHHQTQLKFALEKKEHITKLEANMRDVLGLYEHCTENFEVAMFDYEMTKES